MNSTRYSNKEQGGATLIFIKLSKQRPGGKYLNVDLRMAKAFWPSKSSFCLPWPSSIPGVLAVLCCPQGQKGTMFSLLDCKHAKAPGSNEWEGEGVFSLFFSLFLSFIIQLSGVGSGACLKTASTVPPRVVASLANK